MKSKRLDIEDLSTSEDSLYEAIDLACVGTKVGLCIRGKLVAYLVSKETLKELQGDMDVSPKTSSLLVSSLWKLLILEDPSISEANKQRLCSAVEDLSDMQELSHE